MKRSYQVALGGVTCALGVIFMVLSYYFQIGDLPLMALSSLMLLMPLKKGMFKTAGLCYVAVSLLTFLLTGNFVAIIPYLVFFGLHPIEIALFDRYRVHRVLQALIKLIHCNAALFVIFTFTTIFVTTRRLPAVGLLPGGEPDVFPVRLADRAHLLQAELLSG